MINNKICIIGFILGVILIISSIISSVLSKYNAIDLPSGAILALGLVGVVLFSICYIEFIYRRMMKDKTIKTQIFDERNVMIKEKAGSVTNTITLFLLSIAVLIFIVMDYTVPAVVLGLIIFFQPIIMMVVSESIEKHY